MKSPTLLARELRKNQTPEEKILWSLLRNRKLIGHKFLRQYVIVYEEINFRKNFFILDFYCANKKLAVELDGGYHIAITDYDILRDGILKQNKITVLRIKNEELQNQQLVLKKIVNALNN